MEKSNFISSVVEDFLKSNPILKFRRELYIKFENEDIKGANSKIFDVYISTDPLLYSEYIQLLKKRIDTKKTINIT